ncbi:hypothetical protein GF322_02900 [Candidatus Dependentiae bacterium]|nr:hypothetical protein [Candidatus Dependentiae bacterium]
MALLLEIKVIPNSGKQNCFSDKSGQLKCFLKGTPEKGKANLELISFLAKKLSVPKNTIKIVTGLNSRKKRLKINLEISFCDFLKKLK